MNNETMRDFINSYLAIKHLTLQGLFDEEETATYEHNLLHSIISEFQFCIDSDKEVKNED